MDATLPLALENAKLISHDKSLSLEAKAEKFTTCRRL